MTIFIYFVQCFACHENRDVLVDTFQNIAMLRLVGLHANPLAYLKNIHFISPTEKSIDPCLWNGVRCEHGSVREILWGLNYAREYNISCDLRWVYLSWLPPSVVTVKMYGTESMDLLCTRCLPHTLQHVSAQHCQIGGTLDMHHLPPKLVHLNLSANKLTGTVSLLNPPAGIVEILLGKNSFEKLFVDNAKLPVSLTKVVFLQSNRIECIELNSKKMDARIKFMPTMCF